MFKSCSAVIGGAVCLLQDVNAVLCCISHANYYSCRWLVSHGSCLHTSVCRLLRHKFHASDQDGRLALHFKTEDGSFSRFVVMLTRFAIRWGAADRAFASRNDTSFPRTASRQYDTAKANKQKGIDSHVKCNPESQCCKLLYQLRPSSEAAGNLRQATQ